MLEKINITNIIVDHVDTLRSHESGRRSPGDIFIFFVLPAVSAGLLARVRTEFSAELAGILAAILSVFAALLFNLILLIYDIVSRREESAQGGGLKQTLLRQIYSNISFCILVAILTLLLLLLNSFRFTIPEWARLVLAFSVYYLLGVFVLTLFMVLKRIHAVLRKEVKEVSRQ
jgi:hypothetical protein